jgi:hypothetical protein
MSFLTDLRHAIAETTANESDGLITFKSSGKYLSNEIGVYSTVLPETPDNAIAVTLYTVSDNLPDGETVIACQFMFRSKSIATLDSIEDAIANVWTARLGGNLGNIKLVMAAWSSGASIGQDSNDRLARSVNYYLTVNRPNQNRI